MISVGTWNFDNPTNGIIDFTVGPLDPRFSLTRASPGSYFNDSLAMSSAANDVARFDRNPVSGISRGLLVEGQRANLVAGSASPVNQSVTTAATTYVVSFYGTGTVSLSGTATATINGVGAFPARVTQTISATAGSLSIAISGTVQYLNIEAATVASSFIEADGSGATRAADQVTGFNLADFGLDGTDWTIVLAFEASDISSKNVFSISDGTGAAQIIGRLASAGTFHVQVIVGGVAVTSVNTVNAASAGAATKVALTKRGPDVAFSLNGGAVVEATPSSFPVTNQLRLGRNGGGGENMFAWYQRMETFKVPMSNAQLQALTA